MPSDLFAGLREYLARKAREGYACRVVRQADPEEALSAEAPHFAEGVTLVESERLETRSVGFRVPEDTGESGFRFFLDGVQFSHLVGYLGNVPLVHHLSAAVILRRDPETRQLRVWRVSKVENCLLVPFVHLEAGELTALGVPVENTTDKSGDTPLEATALRALAHSKAQRLRRAAEVSLIREWCNAGEEGWLMVDGPLMLLPEVPTRAPMVGVIKSFGAQFFLGADQLQVMTLPVGHRTTAFQVPRGTPLPEPGEAPARRWLSWYLRLRDPQERDAEFGLLRLEMPPEPGLPAGIDTVSRWLMAERAPLSTPDPRWDNLLYPIHACERYLRSILPERNRVHLRLRAG